MAKIKCKVTTMSLIGFPMLSLIGTPMGFPPCDLVYNWKFESLDPLDVFPPFYQLCPLWKLPVCPPAPGGN